MTDRRPSLPPAVDAALHDLAPGEQAALARTFAFVDEHAPDAPAIEAERVRQVRAAVLRRAEATAPAVRSRASQRRDRGPVRRRRRWLAGVVVCAVLLLASVYVLRPHTIASPPGQTARVELRDGSTVTLDADARLRVPAWFGVLSRTVALRGRAYFAVEPGEQAFAVTTPNARATVLGTRFVVDAREDRTEVVVEEGAVRFAARAGEAVHVAAGEVSAVAGKQAPSAPEATDAASHMTWRLVTLSFVDVPLERIVRELERQYRTAIRLAAGERIRERTLTYITQQPMPLETVLSDLCQSTGLQFRPTAQGFEIVPKVAP